MRAGAADEGRDAPSPNETDTRATAALVSRARDGDLEAFEALYRRHVGRTYALALRMTADAREAEKVTQDVWVRVWEKLDTFRDRSAFTTWLHRVARNRILDHLRRRKRRSDRAVPLDDASVLSRSVRAEPVEDRLDLERAVAALPEGARTMFVLHEVEGLKCREVAEVTGTAVGTVKAQLHRARKLLREALTP